MSNLKKKVKFEYLLNEQEKTKFEYLFSASKWRKQEEIKFVHSLRMNLAICQAWIENHASGSFIKLCNTFIHLSM